MIVSINNGVRRVNNIEVPERPLTATIYRRHPMSVSGDPPARLVTSKGSGQHIGLAGHYPKAGRFFAEAFERCGRRTVWNSALSLTPF
jgi:hypothetical protein